MTDELDDSVEGASSRPNANPNADPLDFQENETVAHFRIKRLLGSGGMGRVFLTRDQKLGRPVALKLIRPDRLGSAPRFLEEAKTIAMCSHPNIVVIYSVGDHQGVPYLALEYLDGESLHARRRREPLSIPETLRIAQAVALALEHAHARGILHCDLKPSNIMLSHDGRPRVVDFGLARAAINNIDSPSELAGTPRYMAPEQWATEPLTAAVDIFALGVIMFELIEGTHPFFEHAGNDLTVNKRLELFQRSAVRFVRTEANSRITNLIKTCLDPKPSLRPSASVLIAELHALLHDTGEKEWRKEVPFRGLLHFDEEHARDFFGREEEVSSCIERFREEPFLAVVGPSGGGKSSFVRAGLIPRFREQGRCLPLILRPGATPMRNLAARLVSAFDGGPISGTKIDVSPIDKMEERLRTSPNAIAAVLAEIAALEHARVLLCVDQLEEVFTHDTADEEAVRFVETIAAAADDAHDPVRVIATVREDFLGKLPPSKTVRRAFSHVVVIRNMSRENLREVITRPLANRGFKFEDAAIVEEMLDSIASDSAGLPMLEFACRMLWERRGNSVTFTRRAFNEIGGVPGAIAVHAKEFLRGLSEPEIKTTRSLLLRLVNADGTRRSLGQTALVSGLDAQAPSLILRLAEARLIATRKAEDEESGSMIELAHESLISRWEDLANWIDESREERVLRSEIDSAAQQWVRRGRSADEGLWDGDTVREMRARIAKVGAALSDDATAFLATAEAKATRSARRRKYLSLGGGFVLVLVTAIAIIAMFQQREIALLAEDMGIFTLELEPFDWDPTTFQAVPADVSHLSALDWRLYSVDPRQPSVPGPVLEKVVRSERENRGGTRIETVEARSGPAFLEIFGRGRDGERCGSSWIRIVGLPGHAERELVAMRRLHVRVPTCGATLAGAKQISAGEFIRGGSGNPPPVHSGYVDTAEEIVHLPSYLIDRTEVPNSAYAMFASMSEFALVTVPRYPNGMPPFERASDPKSPVANLDLAAASAFCAFMGKRLPTSDEWEKAARGGIYLDLQGRDINPEPRRNFPWGSWDDPGRANLDGDEDGFSGIAPVDAFPEGRSPYGLLNMAGNVQEWTSSLQDLKEPEGLRILRGGSWTEEAGLEHHSFVFENSRDPRFFAFDVGFRCVAELTSVSK